MAERKRGGGADEHAGQVEHVAVAAEDADATPWHGLRHEEVFAALESGPCGLSTRDVDARLSRWGENVLEQHRGDGPWVILWRQNNSPLIWVLLVSAAIAMALGKVTDGAVVLAVVVLNCLVGFVQEYRASKAIEALREMVPDNVTVWRDRRKTSIPAASLVPGDVVTLASGDKVPADVRLFEVKGLRVEEAALTGESLPTEKAVAPVAEDAALGDRTSMAYGGTLVTYGTGKGVVVETGHRTQLGRISALIHGATELETPLTRALASIGRMITIAILALAIVVLGVGLWRALSAGVPLGPALQNTLIFGVALAVGAIPEGLPAIVTIALAIGVRRMAARQAVIRKLPAVETLGSTTVICSDKTGTLTRNEMTATEVWTPGVGSIRVEGIGYAAEGRFVTEDGAPIEAIDAEVSRLLQAAALCNDASLERAGDGWRMTGDPTEGALVVAAEKAGIDVAALRERHPRRDVVPFESENQFMATQNEGPDGVQVWVKGAPEVILARCGDVPEGVEEVLGKMTAAGQRVLAIAEARGAAAMTADDLRDGLRLLGLVAMIDPPREEAVAAIAACQHAGIEVKMITGDHLGTARAIGRQIGLTGARDAQTGSALAKMDEQQLREVAEESAVFARVAPEHKLELVRSLQAAGHVVAMTGDGVNDAPALKQANIGVAMGVTGTSVSKESADIVLLDDNFATIVAAVEEGRRVYDNLIKSLAFVLPTNLALAFILIYGVLFLPFDAEAQSLLLPIQPTQILWINLVATIALALPLAFEAKEPDIMQRPPRSPKEPVLSPFVIRRTFLVALLMTIGAVALFDHEYARHLAAGASEAYALAEGQTLALTTIILFQVFYLLNCRSLRDSILRIGVFSNGWVFAGIIVLLLLQAGFVYLPWMQRVFGSAPLDLRELLIATGMGATILPAIMVEKWFLRRAAGKERPVAAAPEPPRRNEREGRSHWDQARPEASARSR